MRLRMFTALLCVALLSITAPAAAQDGGSAPTTLYFHIFDTLNKFPINTQPYNASFFDVGGINMPTIEQAALDHNTVYGFSTAGPVEYDFIEAGRPRVHPERGIAGDVSIDPAVDPTVYLYIDPRGIFGAEESPGFLPSMTFRATMREGDDIGSDLDAGGIIMAGQTTVYLADGTIQPTDLTGVALCPNGCINGVPQPVVDGNQFLPKNQTAPDGTPILVPNDDGVVEIQIPMKLEQNTILKSKAFNLRLDWYQDPQDLFGPDAVAQGNLRLVLDKDYLPRLEMNVLDPLNIQFLHPQVAAGVLLVHSGVLSPWGTYDVDVANMTLTVDGPSQPQDLKQVTTQKAHIHNLHDQAAEVTWLWRFRDEGAQEGEYTLTLTVPNLQGTATETATAKFVLEGKQAYGVDDSGEIVAPTDDGAAATKDSPARMFPLVVLGLFGLAFVRRWRP